jgi:hypothetical protein
MRPMEMPKSFGLLPGGCHPGNVCAHSPDDPLAEHDEAHGDAEAI